VTGRRIAFFPDYGPSALTKHRPVAFSEICTLDADPKTPHCHGNIIGTG